MTSVHHHSARKIILRITSWCVVTGLLFWLVNGLFLSRLRTPFPILRPQTVYAATPTATKAVPLQWPAFGQAALGVSGYGQLAENGPQTPTPTASLAKLITAVAVLKVRPIAPGSQGATLTLTQQDVGLYNMYAAEDGSVAAVTAGEQISEYQVLQAMLLPSANNLADSLAVWAFGSLPAYATYANHMLATLGLSHTHVGSDASGFQPDTTSTASDLIHLGEIATANPVIAGIATQSTANLPVAGTVRNVNWLLGTAGISGLKTGNNNQDKGAFLFSALYRIPGGAQITIIGVVMGGPSLSAAMNAAVPLLVSAQKALGYSPILAAGQAVGQYKVPWKGTVTAVTTQAVQAVTWQGQPLGQPVITLRNITNAQKSGALVGTAGYTYNGTTISSSPIQLAQPVDTPSAWWRLLHT